MVRSSFRSSCFSLMVEGISVVITSSEAEGEAVTRDPGSFSAADMSVSAGS